VDERRILVPDSFSSASFTSARSAWFSIVLGSLRLSNFTVPSASIQVMRHWLDDISSRYFMPSSFTPCSTKDAVVRI